MADNFQVTAGSGTTIAADDASGVMYQKIKIADGTTDGTATAAVGGGVEAAALRVTIASDSTGVVSIDDNGGAITVDGTVAVTNAGITTIAGAVAGTEMQVDVLTMPTVTINSPAVTNGGTFAVQESGSALTALQLIDNMISGNEAQVDVVTVPAPLSVVGSGTEAAAMRVTIASDSTGVLSVDDNGGALTVDGTVTAYLTKIMGEDAQVDNGTASKSLRVTVASDSTGQIKLAAGTASIGKLGANSGVDIGDVDITSIAAGTNLIGKVGIDQVTANANEVVVKSGTVTTVSTVTAVTSITNALPAGTNAIGKLAANSGVDIGDVDVTSMPAMKGTGFSIPVTLTVTNGAYTIGDVVGGLITLAGAASANAKHGIINTIKLAGVNAIPYELWFLTADIATPAADNATFTLVAADTALVQGVVPIGTGDYTAAASAFSVASVRGVGLEYVTGAATTSLYAYLKATATTSPGTTTLYLIVAGEFID